MVCSKLLYDLASRRAILSTSGEIYALCLLMGVVHHTSPPRCTVELSAMQHPADALPIAIPAVSSHAIGPRDMGMLTGDMLHGSS